MSLRAAPHSLLNAAMRLVEIEADARWPDHAYRGHNGQIAVLSRNDGTFIYCWGDAMVSRDEAMRRLNEMETV